MAELALEHTDLAAQARLGLGDTEVEQLDVALKGETHVGGADVPVDQVEVAPLAVLQLMSVVQALADPQRDVEYVGHRETAGRGGTHAPEQHREVHPGDVLHADEVPALDPPDLIRLDDGVVVELDGELALLDEHIHVVLRAQQLVEDQLDRHQAFLGLGAREVDIGHPAFADPGKKLVLAKGDLVIEEAVAGWRLHSKCQG